MGDVNTNDTLLPIGNSVGGSGPAQQQVAQPVAPVRSLNRIRPPAVATQAAAVPAATA